MTYILIVFSTMFGGHPIFEIEKFNSKEGCELVKTNIASWTSLNAKCIEVKDK